MSDLAIASASQAPSQPLGAASSTRLATGTQGFFDLLLASSSHHAANSSLLFTKSSPIEAGRSTIDEPLEERDSLPFPDEDTPDSEPVSKKSAASEEEPARQAADDAAEEPAAEEAAGMRQSEAAPRDQRTGAERSQDAANQAAAANARGTGKEAAMAPANAGAATDEIAPAPVKDAAKTNAANAGTNNPAAATVATERSGLVSKPQQALAQTNAVAAQQNQKTGQPGVVNTDAAGEQVGRSVEPRADNGVAIQRPTPKPQAVGQAGQQAGGTGTPGANPMAGLVGQAAANTTNAPNAPSAAASTGAAAAGPLPSAKPAPATTFAIPTGQPAIGTEGTQAKPNSFAQNLKSTPETFQQLSLQMSRAASMGRDRISLQLHPAELGRVDVKLEFNQDQSMRAVISAERPETLDMLQRDARALERALQDAGVKLDNNSLNFAQRNDQQAGGQGEQTASGSSGNPEHAADEAADTAESVSAETGREPDWQGAVNIKV